MRAAATIRSRPCKLTFNLLTLKVVSESRVTWATSVPILVFLGLSVFDLGPMYTRQTDVRRASSLNVPYPRGGGIIMVSWSKRFPGRSPCKPTLGRRSCPDACTYTKPVTCHLAVPLSAWVNGAQELFSFDTVVVIRNREQESLVGVVFRLDRFVREDFLASSF